MYVFKKNEGKNWLYGIQNFNFNCFINKICSFVLIQRKISNHYLFSLPKKKYQVHSNSFHFHRFKSFRLTSREISIIKLKLTNQQIEPHSNFSKMIQLKFIRIFVFKPKFRRKKTSLNKTLFQFS